MRDFFIVLFVVGFISSKVTHSFSYWWIGLVVAGFAVFPDIVSAARLRMKKTSGKNEKDE